MSEDIRNKEFKYVYWYYKKLQLQKYRPTIVNDNILYIGNKFIITRRGNCLVIFSDTRLRMTNKLQTILNLIQIQ